MAMGNLERDAEMSCWEILKTVLDRTAGWWMVDHGETRAKEGRIWWRRAIVKICIYKEWRTQFITRFL